MKGMDSPASRIRLTPISASRIFCWRMSCRRIAVARCTSRKITGAKAQIVSAFNAALEGPLFHGRTVTMRLLPLRSYCRARAYCCCYRRAVSMRLLLLLLFLVASYRWTAHQRWARADYEGRGGGLGGFAVGGVHMDGYAQFAFGVALVDAAGRWNVGIVASDSDAD